jgi:hypothetical protein
MEGSGCALFQEHILENTERMWEQSSVTWPECVRLTEVSHMFRIIKEIEEGLELNCLSQE